VRDRDVALSRMRKLTAGMAGPPSVARCSRALDADGSALWKRSRRCSSGCSSKASPRSSPVHRFVERQFWRQRTREFARGAGARAPARHACALGDGTQQATPEPCTGAHRQQAPAATRSEPFSRMWARKYVRLYRSASAVPQTARDVHDADSRR